MLAYVFWHWKRPDVTTVDYESRQRGFHAALGAAPSPGFVDSFSLGISKAPWAASSDAYEDWYLVDDFGALGLLKDAAVSGSRSQPHDEAAAVAADGAGGVYGLKLGTVMRSPRFAHWFGKPTGMRYPELFAQLGPVVDRAEGALWMRQMTLGPAREFCLHTSAQVQLPPDFGALVIPVRPAFAA